MSTVQYFRHDDAGAPVLSGTVGSLTALLRACLVGTSGIAYGSKPSAGWTEAFIGAASNIAVFRNSAAAGFSGSYVRVNDNGPGTGGAREARLNAYSAMTDVNTGSNGTANFFFRKSSALSSAARNWAVIADEGTCYLYVWGTGDTAGVDSNLAGFGDYDCVVPTGAFRYFMLAKETNEGAAGHTFAAFGVTNYLRGDSSAGLKVAPLNGIGAAVTAQVSTPQMHDATPGAVGSSVYPAGPDANGDYNFLERPFVRTSTGLAGRLRGIALPFERLNLATDLSLITATNYRVMRGAQQASTGASTQGAIGVDAVGPW